MYKLLLVRVAQELHLFPNTLPKKQKNKKREFYLILWMLVIADDDSSFQNTYERSFVKSATISTIFTFKG